MAGGLSSFEETLWSTKMAAASTLEVALTLLLEERIVKEHLARIARKLGLATHAGEAEAARGRFLMRIVPRR